MAFFHNIKITSQSNASLLLGQPIDSKNGYTEDVGFMADAVASLIALLRGIDYDENQEALLDEVELTYAESGESEFVSILSSNVVDEIAQIPDAGVDNIANSWAELELDFTYNDRTPAQMLKSLVKVCRIASRNRQFVAFHSFE